MRAPLLLLLAVTSAACTESRREAADPRHPVSVYLRSGEFVRAEYVDSAWAASPEIAAEARTRALGLLRQYGTPGLDSVVVRVSNRAELAMGAGPKYTRFFRFTSAELGAAAPSVAAPRDPSRPVAMEIHPGEYIRAEYVDSALVEAARFEDRRDLFLGRARQVWGEHGAPVDSVIVEVSNYAVPTPDQVPHAPRITQIRHFRADELQDPGSAR